MPQKTAAGLLGLAPSTVSHLLHRIVRRARGRHKIRGLKTLGVDEISYARGHRYATVVYDLDRSCVVWVGRGKARQTIDRFLALEKANRRIYRAWRLKDEFDQLWEYRARWAAERFLKRWTATALKSRLEPLRKFVGTVRKHAE